jgi:hypothetical protein
MTASKFTTQRTERIIQAAALGASQDTAAALAGIDQGTLSKWLARGQKELEAAENLEDLTAYAHFAQQWNFAQAAPRERALSIVHREMESNPRLAWDYLQRKEPGYAPPSPELPDRGSGPVIIQLSLADGSPLGAFGHDTAIEVPSEPHDSPDTTATDAADPDTATTVLTLADRSSE